MHPDLSHPRQCPHTPKQPPTSSNTPGPTVSHTTVTKPRDRTERQDWARGWAKLKAYVEREGSARVPYGHREGSTPLGQWVAEQRRAYGAGEMSGLRARRLEELGMVWSVADERFQENLAAAKAYYEEYWTLCAPRTATVLDRPVGQ